MTRKEVIKKLKDLNGNSTAIRTLNTKISKTRSLKYLKHIIIEHTNYLDDTCKFTERLYQIIYDLYTRPFCKGCNVQYVNFLNFSKGYSQYCSVKCMSNSDDVRQKTKDTCQKRFGTDYPLLNKEIIDKRTKTFLKNFGETHPFKNKEFHETVKATFQEKFNSPSPFGSKKVQEKTNQTNLKKRGVKWTLQDKSVRSQIESTNLKKYGSISPFGSDEIQEKKQKIININFFQFLNSSERIGKEYKLITTEDEYIGVKKQSIKFQHKKCKLIFTCSVNNGRLPRCPKCYPKNMSSSEIEVQQFVLEYFKQDIQFNNRTVISPLELDIYIPELKLAIEFNGIYWHSEKVGKDKNYHLNKTKLCNEKDIQLVHIFEDEWIDKKEIIKSILLNKFNQNSKKIFARKCEIGEISNTEAKDFMFENHIQGFVNGTHYALAYEDKLVSVMTVGKSRFDKNVDIEVYRFCSKLNHQVLGGLSRLTKHVERTLKPASIVTYADLRFGVGKGYLAAGYTFDSITNPGYFYVKSGSRFSRQKFQKHKLKKILNTFDESLTESQNMFENGYTRIWDCGNVIFKKTII